MRLLWADDDSTGKLAPLGRKLEREGGFNISSVTTYHEAKKMLIAEARGDGHGRIEALMLDTILPNEAGKPGLDMWLGIDLARQAAELGIRTIIFLTVVRRGEVWDEYTDLQAEFPQVTWDYFDKLTLFDPRIFEEMIASLKKAQP